LANYVEFQVITHTVQKSVTFFMLERVKDGDTIIIKMHDESGSMLKVTKVGYKVFVVMRMIDYSRI